MKTLQELAYAIVEQCYTITGSHIDQVPDLGIIVPGDEPFDVRYLRHGVVAETYLATIAEPELVSFVL